MSESDTDKTEPEPRKPGAPTGNQNALKNGSRSRICRGSKLRKGQGHIEIVRNRWLSSLEAAVTKAHGEIGPLEKAKIESIGDCIAHKMILQKRYRNADEVSLDDETKLMESIQRANLTTMKLMKELGVQVTKDDSGSDDDWPSDN